MAKTNNLTDFLTGLADKFRAKLGGTALINPQSFESKIDEVYQKGYDSAPQGVDTSDATAAADDVQNGKTFYAGGVKKTGSLNVTAGLIDSAVTVVDEPRNNRIYAQNAGISQKAIYNKNTKTKLLIPYEKAISAIGLTADKIVSGNTILGVAGTAQTGVDTSDATATAADVLQGKIFYGADGTKQTGEVYVMDRLAGRITNYGGTISGGSVTNNGNGTIGFYSDPYGFPLYLKGTGGFSVDAPYSVVAQAIGLTGDKIVSGNTILGVNGTAATGGGSTEPEYGYGEFTYTKNTVVEGHRIQVAKQPQFMTVSLDICDYSDLDNLPGSYGYPCVIMIRLDWNSGKAKMLYKMNNGSACEETVLSDLCTYSNGVVVLSDLNTVSKNRYFAFDAKYNYFIKY